MSEAQTEARRRRAKPASPQHPRLSPPEELALIRQGDKAAHDLNNLLMVILGNAEQIAEDARGTEIEEMAAAIVETAEQCSLLNRQLLALAHRLGPQPEAIHLDHFMTGLFHVQQEAAGIGLELQAGAARCRADKIILEATIRDLLSALRASAGQDDAIAVSTRSTATGAARHVVVGMRRAGSLPAAWRQLLQASRRGSRETAGTGAALVAARSFAHRSGGDLRLGSDDTGAWIELLLPEEPSQPQTPVT